MDRSSGILLPISALPSRYGIGTMAVSYTHLTLPTIEP